MSNKNKRSSKKKSPNKSSVNSRASNHKNNRKENDSDLTLGIANRVHRLSRTTITLGAPSILFTVSLLIFFDSNSVSIVDSSWADAFLFAAIIFSMLVLFMAISLDLATKTFPVQESPEQRELRKVAIWKYFIIAITFISYAYLLKFGIINKL